MKKTKKFLSAVLAASMVLSLAACGNSKGASDTFKIGGSGPLTGPAAEYGTCVKNSAQIAIDEINAAGGVNGHKLELNFQDDEASADKSVNAYNTVKDWGAQIFLGTVTSGACMSVIELTKDDNMFQITPSGTSKDITQYSNTYRICFSDPDQGAASAEYIGSKNLASKVGIIYDSSDVYSSGIYESFMAESKNWSYEVVSEEAFTSTSKTDFSVQIQKAKDAGADLLFLPFYYQEASLVLTQANAMGYHPTYFSCDGMDGILSVDNFDKSLAEGVMLLTPFAADATDEKTVKFVNAYKEKYNTIPNQFGADAYDAVYVIKAALEASKATPSMSTSEICDKITAAMATLKVDGLTGTGITWDANGEPKKAPKAVTITNGVYVMND